MSFEEEIQKDLRQRELYLGMSNDELLKEYQQLLNSWRPDWRSESKYKDHKFTDKLRVKKYERLVKDEDLRFAWEFLRRNKDYQNDFCKLWLNGQEEIIMEPEKLIAEKYGLKNSCLFAPWKDSPAERVYRVDEKSHKIMDSCCIKLIFESSARRPSRRYADSDIALYFDEQENITDQLKEAENYLRSIRDHSSTLIKSGQQHKLRRNKYKNYLRIIDAVDSGATSSDIGKELFLHKRDDSANMLVLVNDQKKQAEIMRSYGFLHLGAASTERYAIHPILIHG